MEWWLPGAEARGMESVCLMAALSVLRDQRVLEMDVDGAAH